MGTGKRRCWGLREIVARAEAGADHRLALGGGAAGGHGARVQGYWRVLKAERERERDWGRCRRRLSTPGRAGHGGDGAAVDVPGNGRDKMMTLREMGRGFLCWLAWPGGCEFPVLGWGVSALGHVDVTRPHPGRGRCVQWSTIPLAHPCASPSLLPHPSPPWPLSSAASLLISASCFLATHQLCVKYSRLFPLAVLAARKCLELHSQHSRAIVELNKVVRIDLVRHISGLEGTQARGMNKCENVVWTAVLRKNDVYLVPMTDASAYARASRLCSPDLTLWVLTCHSRPVTENALLRKRLSALCTAKTSFALTRLIFEHRNDIRLTRTQTNTVAGVNFTVDSWLDS